MEKFKQPKKIIVGPFAYKVLFKPTMEPYNDWVGLSDHNAMEIWILGTLTLRRQQETMVHEIDHCIQQVYQAGLEQPTGEQQAAARGNGWLHVIRDNPDFVAWVVL